ncbi:LysR family transcriptional regulator [Sphingomonas flavalba]|uniref:LysR family transcriptional regulator n=1 Tax=Sphingomonas flavalba TaxID=2559804 RepID=UPI00109DD3EA|nr:LysR family transcriptional regulator [Sphingomonas flavalba]
MRLPDFEAWAIFATVVEQRSFTAAADTLGLSKATVSKAVTRLETSLGTQLFHRTSRSLTLTEAGRALAPRAQTILAEAHATEEAARDEATAPSGTVTLAAPMTFGLQRVAPALADFLHRYPAITIDLRLSDAKIDLVAEGIDIALRIASLPDSSLRARRVGSVSGHIVAAPAYLDRHGRPNHPAELGEHACLGYSLLPTPNLWRFTGPDGAEVAVRPTGPLIANSGDALLPALRAGLGIGVLPDFIVGADIASGALETILTDWHFPPVALHLITPPGILRPARVTVLIDHLLTALADCPR